MFKHIIFKSNKIYSEKEVHSFEQKINIVLPESYKKFLVSYGAGKIMPLMYSIPQHIIKESGTLETELCIFSINTIESMNDEYFLLYAKEDTCPYNCYPIMSSYAPIYYCIGYGADNFDIMYFSVENMPIVNLGITFNEFLSNSVLDTVG